MLKNLKKTVGYNNIDYKITFKTVETNDFDINYVIVNGYDVDIRNYNSNHSNDDIDNFILKGILEYIKIHSDQHTDIIEKTRYYHKPTDKFYYSNGASGLVSEDSDSPIPLWLTENSEDWNELP